MASKVLVPTAPFAKLQLKKSTSESSGSGFIISSPDAAARVAHLEHSVRFLQEQHRLMLGGLHTEIEALRERNRDLQFQLIFNKESSSKASFPASNEDNAENSEERRLRREVSRLEREAAAARGEARAAEARALQLQRTVDQQAEKLRELELKAQSVRAERDLPAGAGNGESAESAESRAELRAKLADAERLVRRLRTDADRQRRELQCMKNSLHASLRAGPGGLDPAFGYQNSYHFPAVPLADFWREPHREEFARRRPLTLPELSAAGQHLHRATIYANQHTSRPRANAYESKNKKPLGVNGETISGKSTDEPPDRARLKTICTTKLTNCDRLHKNNVATYPELKIVVTKLISPEHVSTGGKCEGNTRARPKRHQHRKHAADNT